ncbi:MAG: aspartate-semialdehyde dehydrogenase [Chloroflexi bacterium]|nr:aspartate-semialdehyde dehydrogenase [Chloroflexota bacterium]
MKPIRVGILGATGTVGQRFISLLEGNPWFEITALAASDRSVGMPYHQACTWRVSADCPVHVREMIVQACEPGLDCELVFSALPAEMAGVIELQMAQAGYAVLSNASSHRLDDDVPLLIPEVNPEHTLLIAQQRQRRGWDKGFIVTNPNCSTTGLVLALKPLYDAFKIRKVMVTTLQALSGAGYPGVPSLDSLDNVVPFIKGEEEKMIIEPRKLLGGLNAPNDAVELADMRISAACNRVATRDGHLETVSVELGQKASVEEAVYALRSFRSAPYRLGCPSAAEPVIVVRDESDRPQTVLDRDSGHGMAVIVGRVRPCSVLDLKFVVLSHNTIRGAAGGAILNAELLIAQGWVK